MKKSKTWLFFVLVLVVYWQFFSPGIKVAGDFPLLSKSTLNSWFSLPFIWQERGAEGLGGYALSVLWGWPKDFLFGIGSKIGFSFSWLEKLVAGVPIFILGFLGIKKILKDLKISDWGVVIGSLVFLINTYLILLIDGGQLSIAVAYAFLPLAYLKVVDSLHLKIKEKLMAGIFVSIEGFLDIRLLYVLFILLLIKFLFNLFFEKENFYNQIDLWFKSGILIGAVFVSLHFYWILPSLLVNKSSLPATYSRSSQIETLSFANLGHAMSLLSPHWFKNVFGKVVPLKSEFFPLVALILFAPLFKRKDRNVGFWLVVYLISSFLVKGTGDPFPRIYFWLFNNFPGFSLFRDPTKFYVLISLAASILVALGIDKLTELIREKNKVKIAKLIPFFIVFYLLIIVSPVYRQEMTGTMSTPRYKDEYEKIIRNLENDFSFSRILWLPSIPPMGYLTSDHPALEGGRLYTERPFAIGVVGTYELFNFIRESPFVGELFDIAGVGYLAYPFPDTRREELKQDNLDYYYSFLDQLTNLPWVEKRISEPPVAVLKTKKSQDRFFVTDNTFFVVGSDKIYTDLFQVTNLDFSKNALVFAEEKPSLGQIIKENPHLKVVLYDKELIDFAASLTCANDYIFPASQLEFSPSTDSTSSPQVGSGQEGRLASRSLSGGWWKRETIDFIWWRNFLQQKYGIDNLDFDYGGGWAIGEGNKQLTIKNSQFAKEKVLLARVMKSSRGGIIEFWQETEKVGEINTKIENPEKVEVKLTGYKEIPDQYFKYDKADFSWYEVGKLTTDNRQLVIKTEGDINVINALSIISEPQWNDINASIYKYNPRRWEELTDKEKQELFVPKNEEIRVTHKRINPTHYKVNIEGLEKPATLAFSETYDSLWELDGRASSPLYSLINGFTIEKNGEYDLYFSPQKYVNAGLYVSMASLVYVLFLLLTSFKGKGTKI